jgi:hypothetical protein
MSGPSLAPGLSELSPRATMHHVIRGCGSHGLSGSPQHSVHTGEIAFDHFLRGARTLTFSILKMMVMNRGW